MNQIKCQTVQVGDLQCRIVDSIPEGDSPDLVVVLCHGYGAPGDDLVPFGPEILQRSPSLARRVQFVFPEAPLDLNDIGIPGGRAWWHLDIQKLQMAVMTGQFRKLRDENPAGLASSSKALLDVVHRWCELVGVPLNRFVLGGFSQGSMLATDVTLHFDVNPAALVILSGTLLNEHEWRRLAPNRAGLSVLQSHGNSDPILPLMGAEWLRDMLTDAGAEVEFIPFRGGHEIPLQVMQRIVKRLESLCDISV